SSGVSLDTEPARFSAYCPSLCKCSPMRVGSNERENACSRFSRDWHRGVEWRCCRPSRPNQQSSRSSRHPRSSSPVSVGEIVCGAPEFGMPSRSCREGLNTTSVSVRKRVHRHRINFARDRDSRIETGSRMNTPRERPNTGGGQDFGTLGAHRSERLTSFVLQSCPCLGENSVCSERASTGTGKLGTSSYSVDPKCFRMRTMWVARVAQTERATALLRGRKSNPSRCFGCAYDFRAILGLCQTSRGPEFSGNPVLSGKRGRPG